MKSNSDKNNRFWNFLYGGLSTDQDMEITRKVIILNILIIVGSTFTTILGTIAFIQNNIFLGSADFVVFAILVWIFYYLRKAKQYNRCALMGTVLMGVFFAYLMISGGVENTAYLWLFTYPPVVIFLLGCRVGSFVSFGFISFMAIVMIFRSQIGIPANYSTNLLIRFFPVYISVHFISYAMERIRSEVQHKMEDTNAVLDKLNKENVKLIGELKNTIEEVKTLQGIIPICAKCKRIRNDEGYWEQVEEYIHEHSQAQFSHGICPHCKAELYAELKIEDKDTKQD